TDTPSKYVCYEKVFAKDFGGLSVEVFKSAIPIHTRFVKPDQRGVYVLLKSRQVFTTKQLAAIVESLNAELASLSAYVTKYYKEVKNLSGRTPLDHERLEHVYHNGSNGSSSGQQQRNHSFVYWDYSTTPIQDLVEAGFTGVDRVLRIVECLSCSLRLSVTDLNGRPPLDVHRELSPHCQFLQSVNPGITNNNISSINLQPFRLNEPPQISLPDNEVVYEASPKEGTLDIHRSQSQEVTKGVQTDGHVDSRTHEILSTARISQPSDENDFQTDSMLIGNTEVSCKLRNSYLYHKTEINDLSSRQVHDANYDLDHTEGAISNETLETAGESTLPPKAPQYALETSRRESFNSWNGRHNIDRLVEAGLYYTGDQDIVRCFHCDIGLAEWNRDDDPWEEHARHSHKCHFLLQTKGQAYVDHIQREWAQIYSPKRPELSHINQRLETFDNWPSDFVVQSPRQLATAGFYYTGVTDTVRCHYCDGGLREWEPGDVPWVEHAKWFPHCKFVLKIKGLPFIDQCVAQRNVIENPVPNNEQRQNEVLQRINAPPSNEEKYREQEERNPLRTAAAQAIIAMGYSTATVTKCINAYVAHTGHKNFVAEDLMNVIIEREDDGEKLSDDGEQGENDITEDGEFPYDGPALFKMNAILKSGFMCIDCMTRRRQILFQPCGHLLLCEICATKSTTCLRCGTHIQNKHKGYL
ncbi:baculoviral IAP repeat-containing protein 7-A-like, partial [Argopecten irradians]|uniref:baculoviral IAP repeat-containing protein 7-A-like n=1 Tax=Argopecten irradians TaxID=31199 RepID=UPI0037192758